jgi:hypothetical protein
MASRSELNGREKVSPSRILQAPSWNKTANLILLSTRFLALHIVYAGAAPRGRSNAAQAAAKGHQVLSEEADAFASNVMPIVNSLRAAGITDLRSLARALNNRGVRTARGGRWHVSNVKNVINRARQSAVL